MRLIFFCIITSCLFFESCKDPKNYKLGNAIITNGQMPNIATDNSGGLHMVYGSGDSIMYSFSTDNGNAFSTPALISILPGLNASHMRGPQIAATENSLVVTAGNVAGNILSYTKNKSGKWIQTARVNDVDSVAKEGLMALAAYGKNVFAVWLDLRDKHNKIFGAKSTDAGNTWSKNLMIYSSPDSTVCECCKPSVIMNGSKVFVMFRNWLNGNRDMYLIQSSNGGETFDKAEKLGNESWALNGCPMDGGGITIANDLIETVWRRQNKIFMCEPGKQERELGEGKNCVIESVNGKNVFAWIEKGDVIVLRPQGDRINLGKGEQPVLRSFNSDHFICIWEYDKKIHKAVIEL